jgi:hypothetical protein
MDNNPNVEAIAKLITELYDGHSEFKQGAMDHGPGEWGIAEFLASRGVVAVEALTPTAVKRLDSSFSCINGESGLAMTDVCDECAQAFRDAVIRFANNPDCVRPLAVRATPGDTQG